MQETASESQQTKQCFMQQIQNEINLTEKLLKKLLKNLSVLHPCVHRNG